MKSPADEMELVLDEGWRPAPDAQCSPKPRVNKKQKCQLSSLNEGNSTSGSGLSWDEGLGSQITAQPV